VIYGKIFCGRDYFCIKLNIKEHVPIIKLSAMSHSILKVYSGSTGKLEEFYKLLEPELIRMPKGCLVSMGPVRIMLQKPGKEKR
jgi:hypothetical protein